MSIASEITRINGNIASAYTAASNKGATLPATQNSANLATCIASISGGGGEEGSGTTDVTLSRFSDDNGNEIGTHFMNFVDANGNKFKVILLDAQYRGSSTQWCSSNVSITDMPLYTNLALSNWWESKETATYNTQLILDYCSANNLTSSACSHCRSQSFTINGTTYYGQLPNMVELSYLARHYGEFDALDTTASSYPSTNFSFSHSIWSSNQRNTNYAWNLYQNGDVTNSQKTQAYFYTCPVLEIPA